ncbi:MAG: efflux RND transporter periplasmic adaptor subunit [Deltaproteobacteria bacterium]|nr:MAG: efflux RND transporter periplasmic adaptor subunit [Deltaproteobacteria bacterium]
MKKQIIAIAVLIVFLIGGKILLSVKRKDIAEMSRAKPYPYPVEVAQVGFGIINLSSHHLGTVQPLHYADISPRITGYLLSVNVWEGDSVKKGQVLVTIDDRELRGRERASALEVTTVESELIGALSDAETKRLTFEKYEALYKEATISHITLEEAKSSADLALAKVESMKKKIEVLRRIHQAAEVELSYSVLHSPMDGVVTKRLQEPGSLAEPGQPILRVECGRGFKVVVRIPQVEMSQMKSGGVVTILAPERLEMRSSQQKLQAAISRVHPAVTSGTLGTIEIGLEERPFGVPSGGIVEVEVTMDNAGPGAIVPRSGLLQNARGDFVFKVVENKVHVLPVTVLGVGADSAVVTGDLTEGDRVVIGDESRLLRLTESMEVYPTTIDVDISK